METIEKHLHWDELSDLQKQGVIAAHGVLTNDKAHLYRLFELGRPHVVIGYHGERMKYCRIDTPSVEVMKIITREYL